MRLIGAASIVFVLAMAFAISGFAPATQAEQQSDSTSGQDGDQTARDGQPSSASTPSATSSCGPMCCGCTRSSPTVDPGHRARGRAESRCRGVAAGGHRRAAGRQVDLTNPAVTVELLRLNAVVGVKGTVNDDRSAHDVGITCALCHSSVDDSFATGHRQAARRMGQHRPERRRDRRPVAGPGRSDEGRVQDVGTGQIRPAASRVRRHEHHSAEQPVAADRDPADLRAEGRRLRDLHRRRPDLVLEQLCRRRTDGRARQLQRSAHRPVHQADAGPGDAEAAGAARLSAEPARRRSRRRAASTRPPRSAAGGCSATKPDAPPATRRRTSPMC